jgi:hypothetical protein
LGARGKKKRKGKRKKRKMDFLQKKKDGRKIEK